MNKRTFLKTSILLGTGAFLAGPAMARKEFLSSDNEFVQDPLGYGYDALEPYIDAQTMELHYSKHHAGYTKNFNAAIKAEGLEGMKIKEIFRNVSKYSASMRNNGGGFYNHNLFWKIMSPDGGGEPTGKLASAIKKRIWQFSEFQRGILKSSFHCFRFRMGMAYTPGR